MHKYSMYIPIHATAKFTLESATTLTEDEVRAKMLDEGECAGSLCHQCAGDIETDFDPITDQSLAIIDVFSDEGG